MAKPAPFKHGPLPNWQLHPRYVVESSPEVSRPNADRRWCCYCKWSGAASDYAAHRKLVHGTPKAI
jgi:hypothetical protein